MATRAPRWTSPAKSGLLDVRRRILRRVVGQFMRPHGVGGRLAGWVMGHRRSNVERSRWVASLLDVHPGDRVLEIGFGPGVAIEELSRMVGDGRVYGLDHSDVMLRQARRRNAAAVAAGRVDLRLGSVDALPDFGGPLDAIVAVNSLGFWPDPLDRLRQLEALLAPAGRLVIASQPRCPGATSETSARAADEIRGTLVAAGLAVTRVETLDLDPPVVCIVAVAL